MRGAMRPTVQQGQVFKHGSNWVLRFREDMKGKRVRRAEPLAPYSDFPEKPTAETFCECESGTATRSPDCWRMVRLARISPWPRHSPE
jgi:hypothetical protein